MLHGFRNGDIIPSVGDVVGVLEYECNFEAWSAGEGCPTVATEHGQDEGAGRSTLWEMVGST